MTDQIFTEKRKYNKIKGVTTQPSTTVRSPDAYSGVGGNAPGSTKNTRLTFKFDGVFNTAKPKDNTASYQPNPSGTQAGLIIADIPEATNLTIDERIAHQLDEVPEA